MGERASADKRPVKPSLPGSAALRNGNLHVASRERAVAKILKAAEIVFGRRGFDGATTAEIAREAGVAKATVHYYFKTKEELHAGVLDRILVIWAEALNEIRDDVEPAEALRRYIARKMRYSRDLPELTRLWTMEVLSGAKRIEPFLSDRCRKIIAEKSTVVRHWIDAGKMDPIDPPHLFFMIWAATQTYAESEAQISMILDKDALGEDVLARATETISHILLKGLGLR
ncbi:MAG: TetR/AcrR family transcriptional regulator [Parvibaculaceae bacterium]